MQTSIASSAAHGLRRLRRLHLIAVAFAMVTLVGAATASPATAPATTYRIVPLAPNGGFEDINAHGQVAFTSFEDNIPRAKFYDGAVVRDLGTFGGPSAATTALNDHGQVTGWASTSNGEVHAFRWSRQSGLIDLNAPGVTSARGVDINNKGQVTGDAAAPFLLTAFRWSPHTGMVSLGTLGPDVISQGRAINDAGTVVGSSQAPNSNLSYPTIWPPGGGGPVPLSNFRSENSSAFDINNAGQIIGVAAFDERGVDQAFIWTRQGGLQSLIPDSTVRSAALRINEKGLVIGTVGLFDNNSRGFIWSRENGLLEVGTQGVDNSYVSDLNNRGQVVGVLNGRAFIWTRAGGFVDLNSRIQGAPPESAPYIGLSISDNGSIVAFRPGGGLVLLVPNAAYHQPPVAGPVTLTGTARVNALPSFSASFKDVDVRDTHKAVWSWGDGSKTVGTVSERNGTGSVSAQHVYRAAGIYTVRLTIIDNSGKSSSVERKVIVCATHGAISGEGAFAAPATAARNGTRLDPNGSFAFLSEGGAARKAVVQVNVAGMALRSSRVDTVALDGMRVQYRGQGTVNGRGSYRFTLTATSGAASGGKDRIHVRIAHTEPGSKVETVDYDNGAGTGAQAKAADAAGSVVLDGGINFGGQ